MSLSTPIFDLHPLAGDSAPHNDVGGAALLGTGPGTWALVDGSGGRKAWRLTGGMRSSAWSPAVLVQHAGGSGDVGLMMALRVRAVGDSTIYDSNSVWLGFGLDTTRQTQFGLRRPDAATDTWWPMYMSEGDTQTQVPSGAGGFETVVMRVVINDAARSGLDWTDVWVEGGSSGVTPDATSIGANVSGSASLDTLTAVTTGNAVLEIERWVIWRETFTDAVADALRDDLTAALAAPPADTTAPVLTAPVAASTGTTTASGSVSTDTAEGTLYRLASTSSTATAAAVKAVALGQAVTAIGSQAFAFSGLAASTTYYAHLVHTDAAGNDSAVANSAAFTTGAVGDSTPPTMSGAVAMSAITSSSATASWSAGSDNIGVTSYERQLGAGAWIGIGLVLSTTFIGLSTATPYTVSIRARDGAGNTSAAITASFTTAGASAGTITTEAWRNWSGSLLANVVVSKVAALRLSDLVVCAVRSDVSTDAAGVMVLTDAGLTAGTQYLLVSSSADGSACGCQPYTAS